MLMLSSPLIASPIPLQASLAARVHWTVGENTWEMSQGDLLMAACEALDSKAGCATVIVARKLASRSRRVEWAPVADKQWYLAEDTDITQDSASTSIASSSQSPRSTVAESQHQYVWDVTLQTAPAQEFVAHHQVSPCRLRQEGGSRAFRWPQEVMMSPCSVATEDPDWSVAPTSTKSVALMDEMWTLHESVSSSLASGASTPRSTVANSVSESTWDMAHQPVGWIG